jgi:hypothetical protein
MSQRVTETTCELTTIRRLEGQGYQHLPGLELERPLEQVVFPEMLRSFMALHYPKLPAMPNIQEGIDLIHDKVKVCIGEGKGL